MGEEAHLGTAWGPAQTREVTISRLRMESCVLLAASLAACSDRNTPTAPVARPLAAAQSGGDHSSYTWSLSCSGDAASWANWYWTKAGTIAGTEGSTTCYPSSSPIGDAGDRAVDADGFTASVDGNPPQTWTVVPGAAFSAQLKGTYTWLDYNCAFFRRGGIGKCQRSVTGTLRIDS